MKELRTKTFRFPFLGSRQNGEPFQYILIDIVKNRANIAIYTWCVNHNNLHLDEKIDLFIPGNLNGQHTNGIIASVEKDTENQGFFYQVELVHDAEIMQKTALEDPISALMQLIKDSIILKEGILIYLKHLEPYFSRIINSGQGKKSNFGKSIFEDIKNRIKKNISKLNDIFSSIKNAQHISIALNLEDLRENIESEMSLDLFFIMFTEKESGKELLNLLHDFEYKEQKKDEDYYLNYITAIKNMEKRLYMNYNKIVVIYQDSI